MDTGPLVRDEIDAGAEFLQKLHGYRRVEAACWLREDEDEGRYLYAALEGLTHANSSIAYREVLRITKDMKDHYLDPFRVKLISVEHPVAKAVAELHRLYPRKAPTRPNDRIFAGRAPAEVYVYPPITAKP